MSARTSPISAKAATRAFHQAAGSCSLRGGVVGGWGAAGLVALAAFLGTVADSLAGARLPRLGNEATNVLCTLVAAALALVFGFFIA